MKKNAHISYFRSQRNSAFGTFKKTGKQRFSSLYYGHRYSGLRPLKK
jgi:hypothetical protein